MSVLDEIEAAIPRLRRAARALTRDAAAADDLVQDSLERALARRRHWRGDGPVAGWIWKIMLNIHRDGARRAAPHLVVVDELPQVPAAGDAAEDRLALAEVRAAIARLPVDQRQVLVLVALEGQTLQAAAAILGIPEGTLVSRLGRARAALRSMTGRDPRTPLQKKDSR
ncbi:sigma-70 family RNA polymerase sigma factor [Defluviimonas sp. SAOS-178_SWC]|uniref:sigma-70 family RNA polymerase sigma factor n=1 Tax=Defluviimonas sp. SAOS-178_SWC TaxID=3121287 RepID=UPI0032219A90